MDNLFSQQSLSSQLRDPSRPAPRCLFSLNRSSLRCPSHMLQHLFKLRQSSSSLFRPQSSLGQNLHLSPFSQRPLQVINALARFSLCWCIQIQQMASSINIFVLNVDGCCFCLMQSVFSGTRLLMFVEYACFVASNYQSGSIYQYSSNNKIQIL